jgi:hypothetical protein
VHNRTTLIEDGFYISLAVEPSKDYRWLRQEAPADFFSRYPLSEALAFAVQMNLGWRGAAWAISGVLASKAISLFLTLRWRLVCGAVQLTGVLIRKWPPTSTKKP